MKTAPKRKRTHYYAIESYYPGQGWNEECAEGEYTVARARLKEYRENCPSTSFRIRGRYMFETKPDGLEQLAAYKSAVYAQNPGNWYTVEETRAMYAPKQ